MIAVFGLIALCAALPTVDDKPNVNVAQPAIDPVPGAGVGADGAEGDVGSRHWGGHGYGNDFKFLFVMGKLYRQSGWN